MSWQDYVNYLLQDNICESAHIMGIDGTLWASSTGLNQLPEYDLDVPSDQDPEKKVKVKVQERETLLKAISNNGVPSGPAGLRLNNQKFYSVNFDGERRTWYLKKEKGGACICITGKAIVFATFCTDLKMANQVSQNAGECNKRVETLASSLLQAGY
uniref:Profilin n=1 Tax=Cryptocaryon irritans TaxID=153251 RepID=U5IML6_9CILI|nr:profilin [Cryptocaryon irritans]